MRDPGWEQDGATCAWRSSGDDGAALLGEMGAEGEGRGRAKRSNHQEARVVHQAELPPIPGKELCHRCRMFGLADPVDVQRGEELAQEPLADRESRTMREARDRLTHHRVCGEE